MKAEECKGNCLENEMNGEENDLCRDGCVRAPVFKINDPRAHIKRIASLPLKKVSKRKPGSVSEMPGYFETQSEIVKE